MTRKHSALTISIIAVIMGVLIGCLILAVTGRNPLNIFVALIRSLTGFSINRPDRGINLMYPLNWLLSSMPIILTGLSVAFAYRTGLFNIGGEGQFIAGCIACSFVALMVDLPPVVHTLACIVAAALAGAIWAFLPGFLKAYRNINEVVICVMLNYTALYFNDWFTRTFFPIDTFTLARTIDYPESVSLGNLGFGTASQFNWGFVIVLICVVVFWFVMEKTTFGYSLRATGFNSEGSRYAGMKNRRNTVLSMMIAGAFTGIAGAIVLIGNYGYGRIFTSFDNFGFDGISVALVGGSNALGVLASGLLFGLMAASETQFQILGIPSEISDLIQAAIIIFVAIQYGVSLILDLISNNIMKKKVKEAA